MSAASSIWVSNAAAMAASSTSVSVEFSIAKSRMASTTVARTCTWSV
jgi:hypothetical protein